MNPQQARDLVAKTFPLPFDESRFRFFAKNLLNDIDESKAMAWNTTYIKDAFKSHVKGYKRLGTYTSPEKEKLDVLVVHLTSSSKLARTRTALRNFVADHLKTRDNKDAALVAFVSPTESQWRFSYVKMEYSVAATEGGKVGVRTTLTPARRSSYIVGEGESCHTAQSRFLDLLQETENKPALGQIEDAFSVEPVAREFFREYLRLFEETEAELSKLARRDGAVREEFKSKGVSTVDFAKKLLGQIVFLYFIQRKGWLGVPRGGEWGDGPPNFMRSLAARAIADEESLFDDVLEPLFYDTLATERGDDAWCKTFRCRIPFLNGGLFEPLGDYDWKRTKIELPNALFLNRAVSSTGDVGTGILDVFDRYNFTVNESEPLEKEVAIDPEMLGKVFENLIEENRRKGLGAFYTPRELVHFMCQESLINYLDQGLNHPTKPLGAPTPEPITQKPLFVDSDERRPPKRGQLEFTEAGARRIVPREDLGNWIRQSDQFAHYAAAIAAGTKGDHYPKPPDSIRKYAIEIDALLREITVCDPAIGSGAFPVGMMTEIVRARVALTPYLNDLAERTAYHFKRHAIQNCLYGVDVDLGAVEIAKLRLWLSLVVDEEEVRQIKPLPNLDYKIVPGDSLMGVKKTLFNVQLFAQLEELKPRYFDATDREKKQRFRSQIDRLIHQLTNGKEAFDFEIYFSEVFHRSGGFDVVIANPPYISAMEFSTRYPDAYRKELNERFETAKGAYDIYVLFIERGIQLLAPQGVLVFINPNKFLSANYAAALREHLLTNASLVKVVDVSGIKVFEEAAVYPVVSVLRKHVGASGDVQVLLPKVRQIQDFDTRAFEQSLVDRELLRLLPQNIWGFLLSRRVPLLVKLMAGTKPLAGVAAINASSTAGESEAYGAHIRNEASKGSLKVVNTGTIERFVSLWGLNALTHRGKTFLTPYLSLDRAGVSANRRRQYASPKLIFAKMAKACEAFLDREGEFASLDTNCVFDPRDGVSMQYLAGYCNSKLFMFFYHEFFGALRMGGGYYQFQAPQLRVMPVRMPDTATENEVRRLVDRIMVAKRRDPGADVSASEAQIDELLYALHGLSPDETKQVEASTD